MRSSINRRGLFRDKAVDGEGTHTSIPGRTDSGEAGSLFISREHSDCGGLLARMWDAGQPRFLAPEDSPSAPNALYSNLKNEATCFEGGGAASKRDCN